jgi:large conductance mechanosensitive channel
VATWVDLAVGVVVGAAFSSVVQAIVKDILNPLIAALGRKADVSTLSVTVGGVTFPIGDLLQAILLFVLIALIVYFLVVLPVSKLMDHYKPQPAPTQYCPECTSKIPVGGAGWRPEASVSDRCASIRTVVPSPGVSEPRRRASRRTVPSVGSAPVWIMCSRTSELTRVGSAPWPPLRRSRSS